MIQVAISGAAGRMGRHLVRQVLENEDMRLAGALEYSACPLLGQDAAVVAGAPAQNVLITADPDEALKNADAVIIFATGGVMETARLAASKNVAMVIGTTALSAEERAELQQMADKGARIVFASNMSVGVNLLFSLLRTASRVLADYDVEVIEMHHNQKKDAPSGTAVTLAEILCEELNRDYEQDLRHGRVGMVGARTKREIGMHSLRGGDVVGDHTVVFATGGERVELTHKASSRDTFAKGAMRAVRFLSSAPPGLYNMQDVLGIR